MKRPLEATSGTGSPSTFAASIAVRIVKVVVAGEAEQAERLLKQHVMIQGEWFTDFIALFAETVLQATT